MSSTANRVIKNTGYLYAKMGITMFVSLYTTRLILNSLGASDFGIFNIVGGAISMLGFLNAAMASSVQRFMSYAEGEGNKEKQKSIFNVSIILHVALSFLVCVVLVIAGYFFFNGILNIPANRLFAAKVVYGSLVVSTMLTVINVPYDAVMNAHENMLYYAIVGIIESLLKLIVAFICVYSSSDKLIVYGVLMAAIPLVTLSIMKVYCHRKYSECIISPKRYWNRPLMKEMTSFAGWNLLSSTTSMITMQGVSLVLNFFWGVLANAAQGVANQLSGQIMVFSNTMLKALNPAIVKKEGAHSREQMVEMALEGNKFSFLMLAFFAIPFCIETPYILHIWLKNPPEFSVLFCRLILIRLSITQLYVTFGTAIGATGEIKSYTIASSIIMTLTLPLACVLYCLNAPIGSIYVLLVVTAIAMFISATYFMRNLCGMKYSHTLKKELYPCTIVSALTLVVGLIPSFFMNEGTLRLFLTIAVCTCSFIISTSLFGLSKDERKLFLTITDKLIRKTK